MANNTWKNYTQKSTALSDNDEVMLLDSTDEKNKRGLMSKFWDYVVDKMATAVISKLETNNKTIIGAINALNSDCKMFTILEENAIVLRDSEEAKKYFESLTTDSFPHFWLVYSKRGNEGTFFISKSTFVLGTILHWSFDAPQIRMLRCRNSEWLDPDWRII